MTSATEDLRLAADFPPATYDDWRKLVDGVLKGAPFEKLVGQDLRWPEDRADLSARPRRRADRGPRPRPRPGRSSSGSIIPTCAWPMRRRCTIWRMARPGSRWCLRAPTAPMALDWSRRRKRSRRFSTAFSSMPGYPIELQVGPQSRMAAIHVAEYVQRKGLDPAACDIRFGLDPIGACAVWGSSPYAWSEIVPAVTGAIKGLAGMGFKGPFAVADGRVIHDAGGSEVQELAFVLAAGVAYLRALEGAGVALEDAQRHGLCAAFRRCRSVPDDGKIPRPALVVGAHRTGLRPCAKAVVRCRRYRMADADPARPLREHAARDDGDVLRRPRRRQRHHRAAAYAGARDCPIRSRGGWRATRNWCCWRNPIWRKCPIRRRAPAASKP